MRQSIRDLEDRLNPPRMLSLDEMIEYIGTDELLEVTPQSLRMRKRILDTHDRLRSKNPEKKRKINSTGEVLNRRRNSAVCPGYLHGSRKYRLPGIDC